MSVLRLECRFWFCSITLGIEQTSPGKMSDSLVHSLHHFIFILLMKHLRLLRCIFIWYFGCFFTRVTSSGTFSLSHGPYFLIPVSEFTIPELLGCLLSYLHCDGVSIPTVALLVLCYALSFTASAHLSFPGSFAALAQFPFLIMYYRVSCRFITGRWGDITTHLTVCAQTEE